MSLEYLALLQESRQTAILQNEYFQQLRIAEKERGIEAQRMTLVQRHYRGHADRKYLAEVRRKATTIKKIWKGKLQRRRYQEKLGRVAGDHEALFYTAMAVLVQKVYRGYISRKCKQDFYARKAYINAVTIHAKEQGDRIEKEMAQRQVRQAEDDRIKMQKAFNEATSKVHHLVGTKARPGVFAGHNGESHSTAFGVPIESQIRQVFKEKHQEALKEQREMKKERQTRTNINPVTGRPVARGGGR